MSRSHRHKNTAKENNMKINAHSEHNNLQVIAIDPISDTKRKVTFLQAKCENRKQSLSIDRQKYLNELVDAFLAGDGVRVGYLYYKN
jgi:hypothetical protein